MIFFLLCLPGFPVVWDRNSGCPCSSRAQVVLLPSMFFNWIYNRSQNICKVQVWNREQFTQLCDHLLVQLHPSHPYNEELDHSFISQSFPLFFYYCCFKSISQSVLAHQSSNTKTAQKRWPFYSKYQRSVWKFHWAAISLQLFKGQLRLHTQ